ncbi:Crp/Fnr family transcriptional regulator [bacterium]|nr:Crp/Fnr family transcriptional regulator [bacterium]
MVLVDLFNKRKSLLAPNLHSNKNIKKPKLNKSVLAVYIYPKIGMNLLAYIEQSSGQLSPKLKAEISSMTKIERHPKAAILLREGEVCRKVFFVEKGCLRFYYYDDEGKDITHWFVFEGEFITEIDSVFQQKPSEFYIEALEDCTLNTFIFADFIALIGEHKQITMFSFMLMMKSIIELGEKVKDLQFRNAEIRYKNLIEKHSDILLRVPLSYIASYLGITQQSLSRIRREK